MKIDEQPGFGETGRQVEFGSFCVEKKLATFDGVYALEGH